MREWLATKRLGEKRKIPRVYFFHFRTYIHFQRYEKIRCEVQEVNSAILRMRLHETNSAFDAEYCSVFGRAWLIQRDNNKRQNGLHCDERSSLVSCHPNLYWHLSCCIVILWKWSTDLVSNIRIFNFFVFFFTFHFSLHAPCNYAKNHISMENVSAKWHLSDQNVFGMSRNGFVCGSQFLPYSVWMDIYYHIIA